MSMMQARLSARDLLQLVLGDTFDSWDTPIDLAGLAPEYAAQLVAARERSGTDEAVVTGAGSIDGTAVAVIAGEFAFLGGSIGRATARLIDAVVAPEDLAGVARRVLRLLTPRAAEPAPPGASEPGPPARRTVSTWES